jgi:hydroxymethylglutaryl-CoA lyase
MQGIEEWIPTEIKVNYLNQLLKVGFDVLDFGSFVSPKAIPQLKDTTDVLKSIDVESSRTKLLAIIANERGAKDAALFPEISFQGFPFSISESFQQRNTNSSIEQSMNRVGLINDVCHKSGQKLLVYISMAFGNPYGDPWSPDMAASWISKLNSEFGIAHFALADTVGVSTVSNIKSMFDLIIPEFDSLKIGAHLHSNPNDSESKIQAAYDSGCRSFDSAINGLGGCPMAEDDLVGNIDTATVLSSLPIEETSHLDRNAFEQSVMAATSVFP